MQFNEKTVFSNILRIPYDDFSNAFIKKVQLGRIGLTLFISSSMIKFI